MKRVVLAAVATSALLALVICSGCSAPQQQVTVTNSGFSPEQVSVKVGGTVVWTNDATMAHTVTTTDFDSEALYPKATFSHVFDKAGTYVYYCRYHPSETGSVTVR